MTNSNDSAYPEIITEQEANGFENTYSYGGLTKREYFAAMAMQGILSNESYDKWDDYELMAKDAVNSADALINELKKQSTI